jgi:hypothetical protein
VGDLPAFGFFRLTRGVPQRLLPEAEEAVWIFPSTARTFTKDKALSKEGSVAAGVRHGNGIVRVN